MLEPLIPKEAINNMNANLESIVNISIPLMTTGFILLTGVLIMILIVLVLIFLKLRKVNFPERS